MIWMVRTRIVAPETFAVKRAAPFVRAWIWICSGISSRGLLDGFHDGPDAGACAIHPVALVGQPVEKLFAFLSQKTCPPLSVSVFDRYHIAALRPLACHAKTKPVVVGEGDADRVAFIASQFGFAVFEPMRVDAFPVGLVSQGDPPQCV